MVKENERKIIEEEIYSAYIRIKENETRKKEHKSLEYVKEFIDKSIVGGRTGEYLFSIDKGYRVAEFGLSCGKDSYRLVAEALYDEYMLS